MLIAGFGRGQLGASLTRRSVPAQEYAITSDEALMLEHMPSNSIVIVGAGYISVEFASIFRGFGADVHLMFRRHLPLTGCALGSTLWVRPAGACCSPSFKTPQPGLPPACMPLAAVVEHGDAPEQRMALCHGAVPKLGSQALQAE